MSQRKSQDPYEGLTPVEVIDKGDVILEIYDTEPTPEQRIAWRRYWELLLARVSQEIDMPLNDGEETNKPSTATGRDGK